jgi:hypothetical protein
MKVSTSKLRNVKISQGIQKCCYGQNKAIMAYCKAKFLGWGDKGDLNQDRPSTSQDTNPGPVENE